MRRIDTRERDRAIYEHYLKGVTVMQLAERFRLPRQTIHRIIARQLPRPEPVYVF